MIKADAHLDQAGGTRKELPLKNRVKMVTPEVGKKLFSSPRRRPKRRPEKKNRTLQTREDQTGTTNKELPLVNRVTIVTPEVEKLVRTPRRGPKRRPEKKDRTLQTREEPAPLAVSPGPGAAEVQRKASSPRSLNTERAEGL